MRINKREYDNLGGMRNPALWRRWRGGRWLYHAATDHPAYINPPTGHRPTVGQPPQPERYTP